MKSNLFSIINCFTVKIQKRNSILYEFDIQCGFLPKKINVWEYYVFIHFITNCQFSILNSHIVCGMWCKGIHIIMKERIMMEIKGDANFRKL